ncbi:MAG: hypothetical protein LBM98_09245 [Oscillospiraceae bacterium]|nr:hypothetical protein [Oscillospiraceae bacterium]
MLRACNALRIASAAALAKTAHGAGTPPASAEAPPPLKRGALEGRTGDASAHGAGNHPAATRHPSQEGNLRRGLPQPRKPATPQPPS